MSLERINYSSGEALALCVALAVVIYCVLSVLFLCVLGFNHEAETSGQQPADDKMDREGQ